MEEDESDKDNQEAHGTTTGISHAGKHGIGSLNPTSGEGQAKLFR